MTIKTPKKSLATLRKAAKALSLNIEGLTYNQIEELIKATAKANSEAAKKPTPKKVKKQYTLKELCEEVKIEPKAARRVLRKIRGANNVAYVFTSEEAKKVIKMGNFEALA